MCDKPRLPNGESMGFIETLAMIVGGAFLSIKCRAIASPLRSKTSMNNTHVVRLVVIAVTVAGGTPSESPEEGGTTHQKPATYA